MSHAGPSRRNARQSQGEGGAGKLFHESRHLYTTLAVRSIAARLILPRNVRRPHNAKLRVPGRPPSVIYTSAVPSVHWRKEVHHMRCLWCKAAFFRFLDATELQRHLEAFHDRFIYRMGESEGRVTIHMSLAEGIESLENSETFPSFTLEHVYINLRRFAPKSPPKRPGHRIRDIIAEDGKRPNRACKQPPKPEEEKRRPRPSPSPPANKKKEAKKKVRPKCKLPYNSVEEAIRKKRLYHTVVQNPMTLEDLKVDEDSESDIQDEEEWRLTLEDEEVLDYSDTLAVEKLFMNLWNQFLRLEYRVYADGRVRPATLEFVKKYRTMLQDLNMEVVFLRHLNSFKEIGLLDADTIFEAIKVLRDRDPKPKTEAEKNRRFLFAERFIKEANKAAQEKEEPKEEGDVEETVKADPSNDDVVVI